jgi:replication initiation and membrane attachment protein
VIYLESLTEKEAAVVAEAKSKQSIVFLQGLKNAMNGGSVTSFERRILEELTAMRLPDEVINIIVLYTFNRNQKANLVRNYVLMIANDFSYKQVTTAESAVLLLRPKQQQVEKQSYKSNVPSWSNPNYTNKTSPEERAELEKEKQRLLQKLKDSKK